VCYISVEGLEVKFVVLACSMVTVNNGCPVMWSSVFLMIILSINFRGVLFIVTIFMMVFFAVMRV